METILLIAVPILYILITIYLANLEHSKKEYDQRGVRALLYGAPALMILGGVFAVTYALFVNGLPADITEEELLAQGFSQHPTINVPLLIIALLSSLGGAFLAFQIIQSNQLRDYIRELLPESTKFNTTSIVHTTALIFIIFVAVLNIIQLFIFGTEVASENVEIQPTEILLQSAIQLTAAFLGIGFAIRRQLPRALERLGLTIPTWKDVGYAVISMVIAFAWVIAFSVIISQLFTNEQLDSMNSSAEDLSIALSSSAFMIVFVSINAAVSEEIFFRGALQPIFGNVVTSIFFTLLHTQVLLSPGVIAIFGVSIIFGIVRQRYNTTTAIIAHFLYDLIILILASAGA